MLYERYRLVKIAPLEAVTTERTTIILW